MARGTAGGSGPFVEGSAQAHPEDEELLRHLAIGCEQTEQTVEAITHWRDAIGWWRSTKPLLGIVALVLIDLPWLLLVNRREPARSQTLAPAPSLVPTHAKAAGQTRSPRLLKTDIRG